MELIGCCVVRACFAQVCDKGRLRQAARAIDTKLQRLRDASSRGHRGQDRRHSHNSKGKNAADGSADGVTGAQVQGSTHSYTHAPTQVQVSLLRAVRAQQIVYIPCN